MCELDASTVAVLSVAVDSSRVRSSAYGLPLVVDNDHISFLQFSDWTDVGYGIVGYR